MKKCYEALKAIVIALREPAGGEYWTARKLADKWGIYNEDLDGERVLLRLAEYAIAEEDNPQMKSDNSHCVICGGNAPHEHTEEEWETYVASKIGTPQKGVTDLQNITAKAIRWITIEETNQSTYHLFFGPELFDERATYAEAESSKEFFVSKLVDFTAFYLTKRVT